MKLTKKQQEAKDYLKKYIKPKTLLIIQITSVSSSGMSRKMKVYIADKKTGRLDHWTYHIADLLNYNYNQDDTITVRGCGMDMAFWLADKITYYLYNGKTPKNAMGNGGTCLDWQTIY